MRKEEERCKHAFDTFLRQHCQVDDIVWEPGDEPPDYYLQLNCTKYAVEVTALTEVIQIKNNIQPYLSFLITVDRFIKQLKQEASKEGILTGAYVVRYGPLDDFGKKRETISKSIMGYLRANKDVPSAPEEVVLSRERRSWYIKKYNSEKRYLTGNTSDAKWRGEAEEELCILLNQTITNKARKLAAIPYPKILLIADRYPWLESSDWKRCLPNLSSISDFHTIFLVSDERGNSIINSIESTWLNQP